MKLPYGQDRLVKRSGSKSNAVVVIVQALRLR